jgi:hypothetical protein
LGANFLFDDSDVSAGKTGDNGKERMRKGKEKERRKGRERTSRERICSGWLQATRLARESRRFVLKSSFLLKI